MFVEHFLCIGRHVECSYLLQSPKQPSESNSERTAPILQMGLWNPEKAWLVVSHVSERQSIWLQSLSPQGPGCPLTTTDADPEMWGEAL